jgi:hypothetical protein
MSAEDPKPKPTAVPATPAMVRRARTRWGRPGAEIPAGVGALAALALGVATCSDETGSSGDVPPMIAPMPGPGSGGSGGGGGDGGGGGTPDAGSDAGDAGDDAAIPPMPAPLRSPTPPKT